MERIKWQDSVKQLKQAIHMVSNDLIERRTLSELIILCAIAQEHLVVIGPPGTAKSIVVRRTAKLLGSRYFEYIMGRFTEPSEIFGPVDLNKLKEGRVETATEGMLPEADIAFLDEVFQGSTAILNTLLGILNERLFTRGHTQLSSPLRVCVAASNALPTDPSLKAFADRFLVNVFIDPVPDNLLEDLLNSGWQLQALPSHPSLLTTIDDLAAIVSNVNVAGIQPDLAHCIRILRKHDIYLSDRRIVKAQKLIAAAAILAEREAATQQDLWPLVYIIPNKEQQTLARDCLSELLNQCENATLFNAVGEASNSLLAKAEKLTQALENKFAEQPTTTEQLPKWKLATESILREIDSCFSKEHIPEPLNQARTKAIELIGV